MLPAGEHSACWGALTGYLPGLPARTPGEKGQDTGGGQTGGRVGSLPPAGRPVSPVPRVMRDTASSAASGATSAMNWEEARLPSASSAPANPTIRTATAT